MIKYVLGIADRIHDGKKQLNENLFRAKVIDAIVDKNAYNLDKTKEKTGLDDKDIDSVIESLEQEGFISCNRKSSEYRVCGFEILNPLK